MTQYETFRDSAYFDMWCVREVGQRDFGRGFHVSSEAEAIFLANHLITIAAQRDRLLAALTPDGDTKRAYMAEIYDADHKNRPVSWTAIKAVMALIRKEGGL